MLGEGDIVRVTGDNKYAGMGLWRIVKVNPVKFKLALITNPSYILNAPHGMVALATAPGDDADEQVSAPPPGLRDRPAGLRTGAIVKLRRDIPKWGLTTDMLFIVFKDAYDRVNITTLGGRDDRLYWRVFPQSVKVIDPALVSVQVTTVLANA